MEDRSSARDYAPLTGDHWWWSSCVPLVVSQSVCVQRGAQGEALVEYFFALDLPLTANRLQINGWWGGLKRGATWSVGWGPSK